MSTAQKIKAIVGGMTITYKDQLGNDAQKKHSKKSDADTFSWKSDDGRIEIQFPNGDPFDPHGPRPPYKAKKGQWTTPVTCVQSPAKDTYKYNVLITNDHGKTIEDDPQIIFDSDNISLSLGVDDLTKVAESAQKAWGALFAELKNAAQTKHDPQGLFFPQGINLISVDVEVGPVKVIVKVAGPNVSSVEESQE
jgi:hypothetical protein